MGRYFKSAVPSRFTGVASFARVFLILLILILPALWSLLRPGFFVSDDGEWMIIRLTAFHQALAAGEFPVRFVFRLNHEYGYPVLNFLYPGGFYLGEAIHLLGFNFIDSIKIVFGLSVVGATLFSYLWLRTRFSTLASLLGSLFYVYSPYFLWDIYKRGSMGEVLALSVIPLFFWAVERRNWLIGSLAYSLLIVSHNIIAVIFMPFLIIYSFVTLSLKHAIRYTLYAIPLGLALSAFFWLPAIIESKLTVLSKTVVGNPLENFVTDVSLFGWVNISILFLAFLIFLRKKDKLSVLFLSMFLLAIFLSGQASVFFWKAFPWSFLIQFPFRFLSLTLPAVAFLAAFVFDKSFQKRKILWLGISVAILFYFSLPFTKPVSFFQKNEGFYLTNEHSTTIHDEYMPVWVKVKPTERPKEKVGVIEGQAKIELLKDTGRQIKFKTKSTIPAIIRVNVIYYPGWQVLIDGEVTKFSYQNEKGVIEIPVKEGEHQILVEFRETPFRAFSDIISLATLGVLIFIGLRNLRIISHK